MTSCFLRWRRAHQAFARRFFPGWDEPQFRTPYNLSVVVPAGGYAVLGRGADVEQPSFSIAPILLERLWFAAFRIHLG